MKICYRGLVKTTGQIITLFALSNLWFARKRVLPLQGGGARPCVGKCGVEFWICTAYARKLPGFQNVYESSRRNRGFFRESLMNNAPQNPHQQPLVSIVMNCYNGSAYLREAIDSVLNQSYQNWELVFWDNQSTDDSATIILSYSDPRIRYQFATKHTSLGLARNQAVAVARGEWVAFLDCDDFFLKNKIERQVQKIKEGVGIVYSRVEMKIESSGAGTQMAKSAPDKKLYPAICALPNGRIFNLLLFECFIPLPSVMILRSLYEKVGGIDDTLEVAEDYDIFLKVAKISKVCAVDEALSVYRVHDSNMSHASTKKTFIESIAIVKKYLPSIFAALAIMKWNLQYFKAMLRCGLTKNKPIL